MKERSKLNVLGTEYTIYSDVSAEEKPILSEADGFCDFTSKEICIAKIDDGDPFNMSQLNLYEEKVLRHEVIHAFLFESRLDVNSDWARNEEIVDWIAIQFPKIKAVFEEIKI